MLRIVTAALVTVEAAVHGCSLCSEVSPATLSLGIATGMGIYSLVSRWADRFFSGEMPA